MDPNSTQSDDGGIDALAACAALARDQDRERWLAAGLAPPARRAMLHGLIAFNAEVSRTREAVSEPMLGLIRLQWWRDTIAGASAGEPRAHPVARAVTLLLADGQVDAARLTALIDGRERDLELEGIATLDDFLAYADATAGAFNRAALAVLGITDGAASEAVRGIARATAIAGQLRSVAANAAHGRVVLPRAHLGGYGVSVDALLAGRAGDGLKDAARDLAERARHDIAAARRLRREVPKAALPVLVAARFAETHLARLARAGFDVFSRDLEPPPLALPLALVAAQVTGRY